MDPHHCNDTVRICTTGSPSHSTLSIQETNSSEYPSLELGIGIALAPDTSIPLYLLYTFGPTNKIIIESYKTPNWLDRSFS